MFFRKIRTTAIIGILLISSLKDNYAQKEYSLNILIEPSKKDIQHTFSYKTLFSDSLQRKKELNNVIRRIFENGYITASINKINLDSTNLTTYIKLGNKYTYFIINNDNEDLKQISRLHLKQNKKSKNFKNYQAIEKQIELIIKKNENNGYPFVEIHFDSINIGDSLIKGKLVVDKNEKYTLDSIIIKGTANLSTNYLQNYIGIKPNSLYNESLYNSISKKIEQIEFFKIEKPFDIKYYENKANLILYLDKKRANQFDGIIGFTPNSKNGKLLFTGDVKLLLSNSFNKGEQIAFKWQKFDKFSQNLTILFDYPFIFSSPFGGYVEYHLYKKDTTYISNTGSLGLKYLFEGNNYLKAFYKKQNTTPLVNLYNNDSTFLNIIPSKINFYGLEFKKQNLNSYINPSKGYIINISCSVGSKEIKYKSDTLKSLNNLKLNSTQYLINGEFSYFVSIINRNCVYFNTKNGKILNDYLFNNDLYRLGGLKTLRGFDEESILASYYSIFTIEYRYLYEESSYLNIFVNGCYYEMNTMQEAKRGKPFGFGAGINFNTPIGFFSLNYALGKQDKEPIYLKKAKIHFGIINYF